MSGQPNVYMFFPFSFNIF